eukprot:13397739-Ditylum_brightwellii.AAC.1
MTVSANSIAQCSFAKLIAASRGVLGGSVVCNILGMSERYELFCTESQPFPDKCGSGMLVSHVCCKGV